MRHAKSRPRFITLVLLTALTTLSLTMFLPSLPSMAADFGVDRTVVTAEFEARNGRTLVTLTHRGFSRQEFADKHTEGWAGCLDNMVAHFDRSIAEAGS